MSNDITIPSEITLIEPLTAFDTETERIGPGNVVPNLVCLTTASQDIASINATSNKEELDEAIASLILNNTGHIVGHNVAYDLAVLCRYSPALFSPVFKMLEQGRIHCTKMREKLLNVSSHGKLDKLELPGGERQQISYGLKDLAKKYLGIDMTAVKDSDDSWRLNYADLQNTSLDNWPKEAIEYAVNDSVFTRMIHLAQEESRRDLIQARGIDPFITEDFRVMLSFCLQLMTAWGIAVNPEEKEKIVDMLNKELAPEKTALLVEHNILRPGTPDEPYANGARDHVDGCPKKKDKETGLWLCECPVKVKKGTKESVNKTALIAYVRNLAKQNKEIQLRYTDPSDKFPEGQVSIGADWLEDYWHVDPVLEQYYNRQKLQKLVTTEIPRMEWEGATSPVVHPNYDALKETGRTSSFGGELYPSVNIQNIDPRVRACYIPRPGTVFCGNDYSGMELCSLAQKCLDLFGESVLASLINNGIDAHEFLGAQIAAATHQGFREYCSQSGANDPYATYSLFHACKTSDDEATKEFWGHYRKLAKPTGLGYPGGLGPQTFIQYAKATYGVVVDLDTATQLRELWRATFPEMVKYHNWINTQCIDPYNGKKQTEEGKSSNRYAYTTPLGMYRAGCDYCAAANGAALQSPSAEGALTALINVVRACYDPDMNSILYGGDEKGPFCRPGAFIHDEIICELREDENMTARAREISRIMETAFVAVATPKVRAKAEPVLMRVWSKDAKQIVEDNGTLKVWEPKDENKDS